MAFEPIMVPRPSFWKRVPLTVVLIGLLILIFSPKAQVSTLNFMKKDDFTIFLIPYLQAILSLKFLHMVISGLLAAIWATFLSNNSLSKRLVVTEEKPSWALKNLLCMIVAFGLLGIYMAYMWFIMSLSNFQMKHPDSVLNWRISKGFVWLAFGFSILITAFAYFTAYEGYREGIHKSKDRPVRAVWWACFSSCCMLTLICWVLFQVGLS